MGDRPLTAGQARRVQDVQGFFNARRAAYPGARAKAVAKAREEAEETRRRGNRPPWVAVAAMPSGAGELNKAALEPGTSATVVQWDKDVHGRPIPNSKSEAAAFWGTERADAASAALPSAPRGVQAPDHEDWDQLTAVGRRAFFRGNAMQNHYARRHEATLPLRRVADVSQGTLDNRYRQQLGPNGQPLINSLFKDPNPHRYDARGRPLQPRASSAHGVRTQRGQAEFDFIAENMRWVRESSGVVAGARTGGELPGACHKGTCPAAVGKPHNFARSRPLVAPSLPGSYRNPVA